MFCLPCYGHFGRKAWWEGFCVGVGLVGALCGTELCAGKRAWLVLAGLHGTPPRFPSGLSLQFHPPRFPSCLSLQFHPTALSLRSQPPVSPTVLSFLSQPPVSPTMLSLLYHPPLFTFSHFRRFHSRLWRTPRILSPCTLKCSWRVCVQPCCLSISYQNVLPSAPCRIFT